jgi:diadenosine tetraphosphate (Ap4A) HIT family hydrolase
MDVLYTWMMQYSAFSALWERTQAGNTTISHLHLHLMPGSEKSIDMEGRVFTGD